MNKHIYIDNYGSFLGVTSQRLCIYHNKELVKELPLRRIKSINILKKGVSISSDLINLCTLYGIKIFFLDFRKVAVSALYSTAGHAVANVRRAQFLTLESSKRFEIASSIIETKLRNQKSTLQYFFKYHKTNLHDENIFKESIDSMSKIIYSLRNTNIKQKKKPLEFILGKEGSGANIYFNTLKQYFLNNTDFSNRVGRGAEDIVNKSLNYGYAILSSFVWQSVINSGLEPYAGVLHTQRAGKPSLILDLMEEYRAWVVDRNIIKIRNMLATEKEFNAKIKHKIKENINNTIDTKHLYHGKRIRLESIIQRQVYKLVGCFVEDNKYKGYRFKW